MPGGPGAAAGIRVNPGRGSGRAPMTKRAAATMLALVEGR